MQKIILASGSPRRRELLSGMGLDFEIKVSGIEEEPLAGESPREHALRLAQEKALSICASPEAFVIGADTIVIIEGEVLGKPENPGQAREMLQKLSGRTHQVITGYSIVRNQEVLVSEAVESSVVFNNISEEELTWYIKTSEPYDKAGAYAMQGIGAVFIREIHGSFTNVIGLPLAELAKSLRTVGALRLEDLRV